MRRWTRIAAVVALSAAIAVPIAAQIGGAAAPPSTVAGGQFQLQIAPDHIFCLDTDEQSVAPRLVLSPCSAAESQRFMFLHGADGQNVVADHRGDCLSQGARLADAFFAVRLAPCTYGPHVRWSYSATGQMVRGDTGRCLDVPRAGAGAEVHLVPCQDVSLQQWKLVQ